MGLESGRLHFSWISSAEATKFVDMVKEITEQVRQLGPAAKLIKELPVLDEYSISRVQIEAGRG
jgi:F420-non-reducing hydrogenase iron-sulfur subunit